MAPTMLLLLLLLVQFFPLPVTANSTHAPTDAFNLLCNHSLTSNTHQQLFGEQFVPSGNFCLTENMENIVLMGNMEFRTVITCIKPRGFAFVNVSHLALQYLIFRNCWGQLTENATRWDNKSKNFFLGHRQSAVLYFSHCTNVTIEGISIDGSYNGFAILLNNVFGDVSLSSVSVLGSVQNCTSNGADYSCSGSGILLYQHDLEFELAQYQSPTDSEMRLVDVHASSMTSFYNGSICHTDILSSERPYPLQSAAALTFIFTQTGFKTFVTISDCNITDTLGQVGSGILATFIDSQNLSNIRISDTTLTNNLVFSDKACSGTALQVVIHFFDSHLGHTRERTWNPVTILNTNISDQFINTAVYISITEQTPVVTKISFDSVSFTNCHGTDRAVCILAETLYGAVDQATYLQVELTSVTAQYNSVGYLPLQLERSATVPPITSGLFTFINVDAVILHGLMENPCLFSENNATAIMGFATDFELQGSLIFNNNIAISGTAFQLYSFSHIFLAKNVSVLFEDNQSNLDGSVIRTEGGSYDETMCVFQVMLSNASDLNGSIKLTFINNSVLAYSRQVSISVSPLYNCRQSVLPIKQNDMDKVYRQIFHFTDNKPFSQHLTSKPEYICLCSTSDTELCNNNQLVQTAEIRKCRNNIDTASYVTTIEAYPGAMFSLKVFVLDSSSNTIASGVLTLPSSDNPPSWRLKDSDSKYHNYNKIGQCQEFEFVLNGQPGKGSFFLSVPGTRPVLKLDIQLKDCPIGFAIKKENHTCECSPFITNLSRITGSSINCILDGNPTNAYIETPSGSWIGSVSSNGNLAYTSICPLDKCKLDQKWHLVSEGSITEGSCADGRKGPFCSVCDTNKSVVFGSAGCHTCSNLMLLTIPAYAVIGIVLVSILYLFQLTLNKGTIGGLILYANMAEVFLLYHHFFTPKNVRYPIAFISLINLQLGWKLCFFDGMTDATKTALSLAFPIYLWIIVGMIVVISRCSVRVSNMTSNRSPQVLITLVHLSFARVLLAAIEIFSFGVVYIEKDGSGEIETQYIWFADGTVSYGSHTHAILLAMASLAVLGFLLPYILLVTFGTCLLRFQTINRFRPYYDTMYAPYKDEFRWWFGTRQLVLLVLYVMFAATQGTHDRILSVASLGLVAMLTFSQAWVKPFKSTAINLLDIFYLTNMIFLLFIRMYYLQMRIHPPAELLESIFGLVPLVSVSTLFYHLTLVLGLHPRIKACATRVYHLCCSYCHHNLRSEIDLQQEYEELQEDSCPLREPLLESQ